MQSGHAKESVPSLTGASVSRPAPCADSEALRPDGGCDLLATPRPQTPDERPHLGQNKLDIVPLAALVPQLAHERSSPCILQAD